MIKQIASALLLLSLTSCYMLTKESRQAHANDVYVRRNVYGGQRERLKWQKKQAKMERKRSRHSLPKLEIDRQPQSVSSHEQPLAPPPEQ
jgi:hypothetical protein